MIIGFFAFLNLIVSCGGGDGGGTFTLSGAPTGFTFTDESGNAITSANSGAKAQLRDTDGNVLFEFTVSGNVNFANVTTARSDTKALVHFPSASDKGGITGTVTLYVPCSSHQNSIVLCPGATSLDDVTTTCTGAIQLYPGSATGSNYTFANATTKSADTTLCQAQADIANFATGGTGNTILPTLTDADLPNTAPCGDQTILTDATFWADLQAVTGNVYRQYFDDPVPTNYAAVCGYGGNFTAGRVDFVDLHFYGDRLNDLISDADHPDKGAGAGVCGDNWPPNSFPKAGTYRHDYRVTANGRTYEYRVRATLTAAGGTVLGQPIAAVLGSEDIATNLKFVDPAGNQITYDPNVVPVVVDYLPNPINSFTVQDAAGTTLFTVQVEVICAQLTP